MKRWIKALPWLALLAWLVYLVLDWAVFKAVFRPDAEACQALAHTGACWGVIVEKAKPILWGLDGADHLSGLPLTLTLAAVSWTLSLPLALLLASGRQSQRAWLSWPCRVWIESVRGVPLIALLFLAAMTASHALLCAMAILLFGWAVVVTQAKRRISKISPVSLDI